MARPECNCERYIGRKCRHVSQIDPNTGRQNMLGYDPSAGLATSWYIVLQTDVDVYLTQDGNYIIYGE